VSFKEKRAVVKLDEKANPVTAIVEQVHKAVSYRLALLCPLKTGLMLTEGKPLRQSRKSRA
jgi:hypothetical protein